MGIIKRNYTTVNNWLGVVKSLCEFDGVFKISVYNTPSLKKDECCFEVASNLKDTVAHFGEYFIYYVTTDKYGGTYIPCLKLLVCKNRPDEKYWNEYMKED